MSAVVANGETADDAFVVELDRFQGPLDLLLHLIREQDIDVFDIPIAQITEQFLRAIEGVEALGLDRAGEFLEMAATLVRIKAQMLLPRRDDELEDGEDPRAELVRRLLEYEHFREVARELEDREAERVRHYGRGYVPPLPEPEPSDQPLELEWDDVWKAVLALEERTREPTEHRVRPRTVTLDEKVTLILDTVRTSDRVEFQRLVEPFHERVHAVFTLMAGLELARRRRIALRQREPFAPLWLYLQNGKTSDESDADH